MDYDENYEQFEDDSTEDSAEDSSIYETASEYAKDNPVIVGLIISAAGLLFTNIYQFFKRRSERKKYAQAILKQKEILQKQDAEINSLNQRAAYCEEQLESHETLKHIVDNLTEDDTK